MQKACFGVFYSVIIILPYNFNDNYRTDDRWINEKPLVGLERWLSA